MKMYSTANIEDGGVVMGDEYGPHFPTIHLTAEQLPQLAGKEHGDRMKLVFDVKVSGVQDPYNKKGPIQYSLDLVRVGVKEDVVGDGEFEKMDEDEQINHMRSSVGLDAE